MYFCFFVSTMAVFHLKSFSPSKLLHDSSLLFPNSGFEKSKDARQSNSAHQNWYLLLRLVNGLYLEYMTQYTCFFYLGRIKDSCLWQYDRIDLQNNIICLLWNRKMQQSVNYQELTVVWFSNNVQEGLLKKSVFLWPVMGET